MWLIKNRVTGEYDLKGLSGKRSLVSRHAWETLARAKVHVSQNGFDEWYMNADFIEVTENGVRHVEPVQAYLKEYYNRKSDRWNPRIRDIKRRLGLLPEED